MQSPSQLYVVEHWVLQLTVDRIFIDETNFEFDDDFPTCFFRCGSASLITPPA